MIYDLPEVKGALEPLPLAAPGTVVAVVMAIAIAIMIFDGHRQLRANTDKESPSQESILATGDLLESILGIEAGDCGFVVSGSQAFLKPYRPGRQALAAAIERSDHAAVT